MYVCTCVSSSQHIPKTDAAFNLTGIEVAIKIFWDKFSEEKLFIRLKKLYVYVVKFKL
jgi:hypothetical protein